MTSYHLARKNNAVPRTLSVRALGDHCTSTNGAVDRRSGGVKCDVPALLTFQLTYHASTAPAVLRVIVGIGGAVAGAVTAIRSKGGIRNTRPAHSH